MIGEPDERPTAFEVLIHPEKGIVGLREVGADEGYFMPVAVAERLARELLQAVEELKNYGPPEPPRGRLFFFGKPDGNPTY